MYNKTLVNIFRAGFVFILLVEIFGWKVLNASVNFTWQGLILTVVIFLILIEIAFRTLARKFGSQVSWMSYAAGFVSLSLDAAGDIFHFYSRFSPWYDKSLHFIGGAVGAIIIYDILRIIHSARPADFSRKWMAVLAISLTFFFAFGYEWLEYIEDVAYWKRPMRLGDAYDTIDDMQLNFLGILLGVFIRSRFDRDPHKHPPLT